MDLFLISGERRTTFMLASGMHILERMEVGLCLSYYGKVNIQDIHRHIRALAMNTIPEKPRFTVAEVAFYWSVSVRTVYFWIELKKVVPERTPGGSIRIPRESVLAGPPINST